MNMVTSEIYEEGGVKYLTPQVVLLNEAGIGASEFAARTCYDSFDKSEHTEVATFDSMIKYANTKSEFDLQESTSMEVMKNRVLDIKGSEVLDKLAWVHFHHSVLEHATLTFLIRGVGRGVLQELARHRIASPSVRSTRYTMTSLLNAFIVAVRSDMDLIQWFIKQVKKLDMFVIVDDTLLDIEIGSIYRKLKWLYEKDKENFLSYVLSKEGLGIYNDSDLTDDELLDRLNHAKDKRNAGDKFKFIVTDNWKTDVVITFNLRSLKNFFTLRDANSAYFQIRHLAQAMKKVTPSKYLELIVKGKSDE